MRTFALCALLLVLPQCGRETPQPAAEAPKSPLGRDISTGRSPEGKALKFVHRGSYDNMDNTYEAITNFFEEKNIAPKDMFIEQYQTDPRSTPENELVITVLVPVE